MWRNGIHPESGNGWRRSSTINQTGVKRDIIVIGASAGGVSALQQICAAFPAQLPASVGIVLHRGVEPSELLSVLNRRAVLRMIEPNQPMTLKRGTIYLGPADHHLLFRRGSVVVERGPREHSVRPSVDALFRSAADTYGQRVVGLLLTGCGQDGVSGLISIGESDGLTLAQDPAEAYMPYMPLNAIRYDDVAGLVTLENAGQTLSALAHGESVTVAAVAER